MAQNILGMKVDGNLRGPEKYFDGLCKRGYAREVYECRDDISISLNGN